MLSTRPVVCPRAKLQSLPWGSPAVGPGTVCAKDVQGTAGTSWTSTPRPTRWLTVTLVSVPTSATDVGAGFVSNTRSDAAGFIRPRSAAGGRFWDTATSTTAERFQPLLLPDGRSLLPQHVHQPGSGYGRQQPLPHLRAGAVSPPPASGEHGADPAQTDVLQRMTVGAKEETGFARATPTSGTILPPALGQPLGASTTTTAYLPPAHRTVSGTGR
ncbi:stabilizer of axonemal microtubules 4 isoform X2 [Anser cygnoides]|uniref:stabilizer of axonemal microtubules 4 isoform X2 n=1 Tax=Anser cygnoides TaxID=8845 RepID=UPI0034D2A290